MNSTDDSGPRIATWRVTHRETCVYSRVKYYPSNVCEQVRDVSRNETAGCIVIKSVGMLKEKNT